MSLSDQDLFATLARESNNISRELQTLLDAQSDGLMKALGGNPNPPSPSSLRASSLRSPSQRRPSTGTSSSHSKSSLYRDDPLASTPNLLYSTRHSHLQSQSRLFHPPSSPIPVRQPAPPKPPTLKQARLGISGSLRALASVKFQESALLTQYASSSTASSRELTALRDKRAFLETKVREVTSSTLQRADQERALASSERELETEIAALEAWLEDLRGELRFKRAERQALVSEREAEVSSWQNALAELDKRIKVEVLSDRGRFASGRKRRTQRSRGSGAQHSAEGDENGDSEVWRLPEDRRTLELVQEAIEAEVTRMEKRRESVEAEQDACERGTQLWDGVVGGVTALERRLGRTIAALNRVTRSSAGEADAVGVKGKGKEPANENNMEAFWTALRETEREVEAASQEATQNGWTLLQVAIGAEQEALRMAGELLSDTLSGDGAGAGMEASTMTIRQADVGAKSGLDEMDDGGWGSGRGIVRERPSEEPARYNAGYERRDEGDDGVQQLRTSRAEQRPPLEEDVVHDGPDPQLLFGA